MPKFGIQSYTSEDINRIEPEPHLLLLVVFADLKGVAARNRAAGLSIELSRVDPAELKFVFDQRIHVERSGHLKATAGAGDDFHR